MPAQIATPHRLATDAGAHVLRAGGNAVDAVVAAGLVLAVAMPDANGLGGDLLALVHAGAPAGYNGSGRAPQAADAEALRRAGHERMPQQGAATVTVPGAVAGWFDLLARFGSRGFGDLAQAATALARERSERELAALLERLAADGPDAFYRGAAAERIADCTGGWLTAADLARHRGDWVEPLAADWRGHRFLQLPPNTQGAHLLQSLLLLAPEGPLAPGELIEACRIAMADRDEVLGDPDHMTVTPAELLDTRRLRRAGPDRPGLRGGTVFLCCADGDGMTASVSQSLFRPFGSRLRVSALGIQLHNRGAGFTLRPGHPNELAPGKRPLHTLIPGVALRDGAPALLHGTMGGDAQVAINLQLIERVLVRGESPREALDAPRWILDAERPGALVLEPGALADVPPDATVVGRHDARCGQAALVTVGDSAASDPRAPDGAAASFER